MNSYPYKKPYESFARPTQERINFPSGKKYGRADKKFVSIPEEDDRVAYLKYAYGTIVAQLIINGHTIDSITAECASKDEAVQASIEKLRSLKNELETLRPNAAVYLKKPFYLGLRLVKQSQPAPESVSHYGAELSQTFLVFNDSEQHRGPAEQLKTQTQLDAYCASVFNFIKSLDRTELLKDDEDLIHIRKLFAAKKRQKPSEPKPTEPPGPASTSTVADGSEQGSKTPGTGH